MKGLIGRARWKGLSADLAGVGLGRILASVPDREGALVSVKITYL
jgi:hypothetical protein